MRPLLPARCLRALGLTACWLAVTGLTGLNAARALTPADTRAAAALVAAYPAFLQGVTDRDLLWRDGTRMALARAPAGTYTQRLDAPGLLDQLDARYPACSPLSAPAFLADPGRTRFTALFQKMYGGTAAAVRAHLRPVDWLGQTVLVTDVNGAASSLRAVAAEVARHPEWRTYAVPSAGTFLWRTVAGTPRRSVHSYGAAIDLHTAHAAYWAWDGYREGERGVRWRNAFPVGLVQTFERHGWIWGGRWYHYDTMHFEYRPELTRACHS
ncbi:M15 family metallopeptidase [Deinococcus aquiradiocola]|uniref:M15 family metallopeptidase n=1 Tax=Deinococcus aquiradiocola TaxID=393059 RepID=UPI001664F3FD|nr:M15 family metallopeptidase [Deinococcus aquiradiocola]